MNPNNRLMGAEAETRSDFERALSDWRHADRLPDYETQCRLQSGDIIVIVTYHPARGWKYLFTTTPGFGLRGAFDSRASALSALEKHSEVAK